jgi:hypothetical protein
MFRQPTLTRETALPDVQIRGGKQVPALAAAMQDLGRRGIRNDVQAALLEAGKPLADAARRNAAATLPKRGGLAGVIASSTITVTPLAHLGQAGVRIQAFGHDPRIDQGKLRHPVYGHDRWVPQAVRPGWFTKAMERAGEPVRAALVRAVDRVLGRL